MGFNSGFKGLMFVLIKNVHSVGIMNGVYVDTKKCTGRTTLRLLTELHYIYMFMYK